MSTKPTITIDAQEIVSHGRPRDVLRKVEDFLSWQDYAMAMTGIEIEGVLYYPAWIFDA